MTYSFLLVLCLTSGCETSLLPLTNGMEIDQSIRFAPGIHTLTESVMITGDNVTVDFNGATLVGPRAGGPPDSFMATAIIVEGKENVTILNAKIHGFKVGIYAKGCRNLSIRGCDLSSNFRQHLRSTPDQEVASDWLWPHHNDKNEWMEQHGAGIYLDRCVHAEIAGNMGHNSQNGIILSRTDSSFVYDNDMSFNSGWGLALWRSSYNEISHNRFDYCVRGYSHGVYHRGQDSAGILVFEQCCHNMFAHNSATHGGDGFFLYAGHETTERTGEGGSNHNVLYLNDFSHAVANGIEATFSDGNVFAENMLHECDYGIWAGYSYNTTVVGNHITRSLRAGVAIEHGHNNLIEGNRFESNKTGILLWSYPNEQFESMPYGQKQNTKSERYLIARNRFLGDDTALRFHNSVDILVEQNEFQDHDLVLNLRSDCPGFVFRNNNILSAEKFAENQGEVPIQPLQNYLGTLEVSGNVVLPLEPVIKPYPITWETRTQHVDISLVHGTMFAFLPDNARRGRETMIVDEWGPIDYKTLKLFPSHVSAWGDARFFLVGPDMPFRLESSGEKANVDPQEGRVPARLTVTAHQRGLSEISFIAHMGDEALEATATLFKSTWKVTYVAWSDTAEGPIPARWDEIIAQPSMATMETETLDLNWKGKAPADNVPADYFATMAETIIDLPEGDYEIHTISDDGVRVMIDKAVVLENWTQHAPEEDMSHVALSGGSHEIRVEHFQIDGYSRLKFWLERRP